MIADSIRIEPLPAFNDNYIWLGSTAGNLAYLVDPGEAPLALATLQQRKLTLTAILITHHHYDHTKGIAEILAQNPCTVYGPPGVAGVNKVVHDGDSIKLHNQTFQVIAIPGHTLDHLAYYDAEQAVLFCGDTLFGCGCGRVFEGTHAQMVQSLNRLANLPADTRVYCGHEYTMSNAQFALAVEPNNPQLVSRAQADAKLRQQHQPTLPSTIGLERATNPFLRLDEPAVITAARAHPFNQSASDSISSNSNWRENESVAVFTSIRHWKNHF